MLFYFKNVHYFTQVIFEAEPVKVAISLFTSRLLAAAAVVSLLDYVLFFYHLTLNIFNGMALYSINIKHNYVLCDDGTILSAMYIIV